MITGVQFTERHLEFLQLFEKEEMANYLRRLKEMQKDSTESKLQKRYRKKVLLLQISKLGLFLRISFKRLYIVDEIK